MSTNPFNGMITDSFKQLHVNMITEVIRGCSVDCKLYFGVTKYSDCANCVYDPIGNKSANRYQTGGPAPFAMGQCPMCGGAGKIADEQTEDIKLCPLYDYKSWIPGISSNVQSPEGFVQTVSAFSTFSTLRRAKEIIIDTSLDKIVRPRFEIHSEPEPCGMGASDFCLTMWKRIENG